MFVLNIIFPISFSSIAWLFSPLDHLPKLIFILCSGYSFSKTTNFSFVIFSSAAKKPSLIFTLSYYFHIILSFSNYLIIFTLSYHFHIILLLSHYLIIVRLLSLFITLSISLSAQEKLQLRLVLGFPSFSTTT